jgi:hypothetical protein
MMQMYYQYHGINLRTCYQDFDRHHMGVVTESQVGTTLVNLRMRYQDFDRHHMCVVTESQIGACEPW